VKPKIWNLRIPDADIEQKFLKSLPVSPVLTRVLLNRGISTLSEAEAFLNPSLTDLYDPCLMDGMDWAVQRTRQAILDAEKIVVHGDYDVDGITSTALLVRVLKLLKADVSWYLPHRQKEGYDISVSAVNEIKERGAKLIITVDCGSSAVEAVAHARSLGLDVIVTDHHEVPCDPAPANVIINPRKPGCSYPFKGLAGVGVAFKFMEALVRECGYDASAFRKRFCDLFAIGTVADVVPLLGENRTLVKSGMEELPNTGKKGLRALIKVSGLANSGITSHSLAFVLAPRLNAAGRLGDASVALRLLLTNDDAEAMELARSLDSLNQLRQAEQERITDEAMGQIIDGGLDQSSKILVLASQGWHIGVIGIVASKVTERYNRPTVLVAVDETGMLGVGSARSTDRLDLFGALGQCGHLLQRYGGHARAAGLSIEMSKLPEFKETINRVVDSVLTSEDLLPRLDVDAELGLDRVNVDLSTELEMLEPYGHGNARPVFLSHNASISQKDRAGGSGLHVKLKLRSDSDMPVDCIAFGWGDREEAFKLGGRIDLCYNIQTNRFNGRETAQLVLRDARKTE
jgi:single-stranded-DNA-specific exonuclease